MSACHPTLAYPAQPGYQIEREREYIPACYTLRVRDALVKLNGQQIAVY